MAMSARYSWTFVAVVTLVCGGSGCVAPQRTTRMTADDLDAMSHALAASLAASDVLAGRTGDSPLWVISISKVQNLSSDVMTDAEQWSVMARLRGSLPIGALWDQKNVRFVIPADRLDVLRDYGELDEVSGPLGSQRRPTHQMTATFRSITRADSQYRTDLYYCEFSLIDLAAGQPVWSDRFEYKRAAAGHVLD
jgi:hypothetical protein